MIRKMKNIDLNRVADIWLKTNLKAHYFIPEQYWTSNYELVKEMLLQAEVYVYEDNKMIQGVVEYIEGIFVSDEMQSCGIGKLLLDYIKNKKIRLRLNVYQKNARALSFYQREGFDIQCDNHGRMQPITKVTMKMHRAVREDLLRYLQSHITA